MPKFVNERKNVGKLKSFVYDFMLIGFRIGGKLIDVAKRPLAVNMWQLREKHDYIYIIQHLINIFCKVKCIFNQLQLFLQIFLIYFRNLDINIEKRK